MSFFITGAGGFVGLALVEALLARGETVIGFERVPLPLRATKFFAGLPGQLHFVRGDVCDVDAIFKAMRRHRPDRVIALAAITAGKSREIETPSTIYNVNVSGLLATLHAAAETQVSQVLHVSSGAVYGAAGEAVPLLEEDRTPLTPVGLYGLSKYAGEQAASRFASLTGLRLTIARLGTCFGPWEGGGDARDTPSALWQIVRLAEQGNEVVLPRESVRDWLYVRDAAAGLLALLETSRLTWPVYNVAANFKWGVGAWCATVSHYVPTLTWRMADSGEAANVNYYATSDRAPMRIARLLEDTDFRPRYDLAASCRDFLDWSH